MKNRINRRRTWIRRMPAVCMLAVCFYLAAPTGSPSACAAAAATAQAWPAETAETLTTAQPTATEAIPPTPEMTETCTPEMSPEPTPGHSAVPTEPLPTAEPTPETAEIADSAPADEPLILKTLSLTGRNDAQPGEHVAVQLTLDAANATGKALQTFGVRFQMRGVADWNIRDCNGGADVRFSGGVLWVNNAQTMNGKVYVGGEALRFSLTVVPFAQDSETDHASVAVSLLASDGNPASAAQVQNADVQGSFAFRLNRPAEPELAPAETDEAALPDAGESERNTAALAAEATDATPAIEAGATDRDDPADGADQPSDFAIAESEASPETPQKPNETPEPPLPQAESGPQPVPQSAPQAAEDGDVSFELDTESSTDAFPDSLPTGEPAVSADPAATGEPEIPGDLAGSPKPEASGSPDSRTESSEPPEAEQSPEPTETPVTRQLRIVANIPQEKLAIGDQLTLTAEITGYDGLNPILQWQQRNGGIWQNIEDAHELTLTVLITPDNINSAWRYDVTVEQ